jgi:hypothetical protein
MLTEQKMFEVRFYCSHRKPQLLFIESEEFDFDSRLQCKVTE